MLLIHWYNECLLVRKLENDKFEAFVFDYHEKEVTALFLSIYTRNEAK